MVKLDIVQFCAEECDRQQSGELSVARMVDAYAYAMRCVDTELDELMLMSLAYRIDNRNAHRVYDNYRRTPVAFSNGNLGADYREIPRLMKWLVSTLADINNEVDMREAWVKELLRIHPWEDGNGRVAAIVWNWLNGTLNDPVPYPEQTW